MLAVLLPQHCRMPEKNLSYRTEILVGIVLAALTFAAYWPVMQSKFVNYDDPYYVTQNPHVLAGLTWNSLYWAFTARYSYNWHPLTWISHMVDCELFGLHPAGHHVTNLLLHILNTLLIFLLMRRMTRTLWRSAFVAGLFALHPLHVESVAWIAERKDVLSTFFWALAIGAYVRYSEKPSRPRYSLVAFFFVLGLMAKPMLVTLPFLLLLLDFWPLSRVPTTVRLAGRVLRLREEAAESRYSPASPTQLAAEKLPLLFLSAISCIITIWAQQDSIAPGTSIPFVYRLCNAVVSYWRYLVKMVLPVNLVINYPYPRVFAIWELLGAAGLLLIVSLLAFRYMAKRPYLLTGWFWFIGTLVPVIGLVQVGIQSMADRYTYVPLVGLFIIVVWGGYDLVARLRARQAVIASFATIIALTCSLLTFIQANYWRNSVTLFQHALRVTPNNFVAEYNLAATLVDEGHLDAAREHLIKAAKIYPNAALPHSSLGQLFAWQGKLDEAIASYMKALRCDPNLVSAHLGLAAVLTEQGKLDDAKKHLNLVLQVAPNNSDAHDRLGLVLAKEANEEEALAQFSEAVRLNPASAALHAHAAMALERLNRPKEAVTQYRLALKLNPRMPSALNNLAWILASNPDPKLRDGEEAVRLAHRACELTDYRRAIMVGTLGAAYAEAGRFDEAVSAAQMAEKLARSAGNTALAEKNHKMIDMFLAGHRFRELPDSSH